MKEESHARKPLPLLLHPSPLTGEGRVRAAGLRLLRLFLPFLRDSTFLVRYSSFAVIPPAPRLKAFTLVELLLALTVTAVVVTGAAMMAWTLTDYHFSGEAAVKLATQGRFGLMPLRRDVRAAQAVALTPAGSLAVWFGDLNQTGAIDLTQLAFYYYNAPDRTLRRLTYSAAGFNFGPPSPADFSLSFAPFDSGAYLSSSGGLVVINQIVCHNVDAVLFTANHVAGQADTVEFFLQLSSPENIVNSTGRPVNLNLYGSATLRAPTYAYGFSPQS